jgi:uroporphyrinogen decarboxylase
MTGIERIGNILRRKPVDRIGLFEHFWGDTLAKWQSEGHIAEGESLEDHFGFDIQVMWAFNMTADLEFEPEVLEEDGEKVLTRDGNGAVLRRSKTHDATPEHVDFLVRDRAGWEEHIKPKLTPGRARINFEVYRDAKKAAAAQNRFFFWGGTNVFELMHPVCGHQYMLMGMATDPDWVRDMVDTYAQLTTDLQEILFAEEGAPDGVWFYEDMGFKNRPFMSADMYREIIQPGHSKSMDYAKSRDLPVVVHSCGYVEPLVPGLIEAGMDALQVIEVKAGMDLLKLYHEFGDRISFIGGTDVRTLYTNDKAVIEAELIGKIPVVKGNSGYVLHSDHSIPDQVEYESYRYFVDRGLELGRYCD